MPLRLPTRPSAHPLSFPANTWVPVSCHSGWSGSDGQTAEPHTRFRRGSDGEGCSLHTHDPLVALLGDERAVRLNARYSLQYDGDQVSKVTVSWDCPCHGAEMKDLRAKKHGQQRCLEKLAAHLIEEHGECQAPTAAIPEPGLREKLDGEWFNAAKKRSAERADRVQTLQSQVNEFKRQKGRKEKDSEKRQARKRVPISHDNNDGFPDSDEDRNDKGKTKSRALQHPEKGLAGWMICTTRRAVFALLCF